MSINRAGNGQPLYPAAAYKKYEDSSFIAGDSPVTHDVKTDLGRDGNNGYIYVVGPGTILVKFAKGGSTFGEEFTLSAGQTFDLMGEGVSQIKITHSGSDSAYRIFVE